VKFLIDECLSLSLAELAIEAGYPASAHVNHRGMNQEKDWALMEKILAQDSTFVTRNGLVMNSVCEPVVELIHLAQSAPQIVWQVVTSPHAIPSAVVSTLPQSAAATGRSA